MSADDCLDVFRHAAAIKYSVTPIAGLIDKKVGIAKIERLILVTHTALELPPSWSKDNSAFIGTTCNTIQLAIMGTSIMIDDLYMQFRHFNE